MKKMIALLLALAMVLACTACGTDPALKPTEPSAMPAPDPEGDVTVSPDDLDDCANYIQLSISYADGTYGSLSAYDDGAGMARVEYQGDVKKVATMELNVLEMITSTMDKLGMSRLNGESLTGEGFDSASMYVAFNDGSYWGADYTGVIPEEFLTGYEKMDAYFQDLLADVPEYVPQPVVMGEVDADLQAEMMTVLENSGLEPLDMFYISADVYVAGLADAESVAAVAECGPMMSSSAYSFTIVKMEDEKRIDAIRQDFANNLDWNRWVCVSATNALIAQKDNMVVCMMGGDQLYTMTARAIEAAGWTEIETYSQH